MPSEIESLRLALQSKALSLETLRLCLSHEDWRVRHAAIESVRQRGGRPEDIELLLQGLRSADDVSLRNAVARALAALGTSARIHVMHALPTLDADARKLALEVLASCPDAEAVVTLLAYLDDPDPNVAVCAIEGLANAAEADLSSQQKASQALLEVLSSTVALSKCAAALSALAALGPPLPDSILARFASQEALAALLLSALDGNASSDAVKFAVAQLKTGTRATQAVAFLAACVRRGHTRIVVDGVQQSEEGTEALRRYASGSADSSALLVLAACGDSSVVDRICASSLVEEPIAVEALAMFGETSVRALLAQFRVAERSEVLSTLLRLQSCVTTLTLPRLCEVISDRLGRANFDDATDELLQLLARTWHGDPAEVCPFSLDAQRALLGDAALDTFGATVTTLVWVMPSLQRSTVLSPRLAPLRLLVCGDAEACMRADDAWVRALGASNAPMPASADLLHVLLLDEDEDVAVAAAARLLEAGHTERVEVILQTHARRAVRRRLLRVMGRLAPRRVLEAALLEQLDVLELHVLAEACAPLTDLHAPLVRRILAQTEAPLLCATLRWIAPTASRELVGLALPLLEARDSSVRLAATQVLSRVEAFRAQVRERVAAAPSPEERADVRLHLMLPRLGVALQS